MTSPVPNARPERREPSGAIDDDVAARLELACSVVENDHRVVDQEHDGDRLAGSEFGRLALPTAVVAQEVAG